MSDLYAFSRRLAAAPSAAEIYLAIEEYVANLLQRNVVLYEAGNSDGHPDNSAVPEEMRAAIGEIQSGSHAGDDDRGQQRATPGSCAGSRSGRPISA